MVGIAWPSAGIPPCAPEYRPAGPSSSCAAIEQASVLSRFFLDKNPSAPSPSPQLVNPLRASRTSTMGSFSIWHWLIVIAVIAVLFGGGGRLTNVMGDFAKGTKAFNHGLRGAGTADTDT